MRRIINELKLRLPAISVNEGAARAIVSAFVSELNPSIDELGDIRCAVSEAVTNVIVHAYPGERDRSRAFVYISCRLYDTREVSVEISDNGCGIENVDLAMQYGYTTGEAGERCGMGFLVMQSFMDSVSVKSKLGRGCTVLMRKSLA